MTKMAVSSSYINTISNEPESSFVKQNNSENKTYLSLTKARSPLTNDSRTSPENTNIVVKQEKEDFDLGPNNLIFDSRQRVYKIPTSATATTSQSQKRNQGRKTSQVWYKCQQCARVYETLAGCQSHIVVKHGECTDGVE